ncbi:hypothetical protein ILUMI_09695 [Ignelater luminosus]|uniref:Uncharacterized protein n=1 Tax=Ignelater luminosus TaxID=2038154 RepID=A0A8K0D1W1_IGNLU|nr:hypothetical protein ILUMI_09695 [Ignelater luminosus]
MSLTATSSVALEESQFVLLLSVILDERERKWSNSGCFRDPDAFYLRIPTRKKDVTLIIIELMPSCNDTRQGKTGQCKRVRRPTALVIKKVKKVVRGEAIALKPAVAGFKWAEFVKLDVSGRVALPNRKRHTVEQTECLKSVQNYFKGISVAVGLNQIKQIFSISRRLRQDVVKENSGVQRRILNHNPRAMFVPCGAHSLNLVVYDAAKATFETIDQRNEEQLRKLVVDARQLAEELDMEATLIEEERVRRGENRF